MRVTSGREEGGKPKARQESRHEAAKVWAPVKAAAGNPIEKEAEGLSGRGHDSEGKGEQNAIQPGPWACQHRQTHLPRGLSPLMYGADVAAQCQGPVYRAEAAGQHCLKCCPQTTSSQHKTSADKPTYGPQSPGGLAFLPQETRFPRPSYSPSQLLPVPATPWLSYSPAYLPHTPFPWSSSPRTQILCWIGPLPGKCSYSVFKKKKSWVSCFYWQWGGRIKLTTGSVGCSSKV